MAAAIMLGTFLVTSVFVAGAVAQSVQRFGFVRVFDAGLAIGLSFAAAAILGRLF